VIAIPYRADARNRIHSRCTVLAGGFLAATLATFARSLPVPLDAIPSSLHRPPRGTPRCAPLHRETPQRWAGTLLSRIPEMNQECPR